MPIYSVSPAVHKDGTLSFLLGDHLGSTSLVTDANGNNPIETRYKAWGEVRYSTPDTILPPHTYTLGNIRTVTLTCSGTAPGAMTLTQSNPKSCAMLLQKVKTTDGRHIAPVVRQENQTARTDAP